MNLRDSPSQDGTVALFFGLVLLLSLPFYALGLSHTALPFADALPLSALMACVPAIAALGLIARQSGIAAAVLLFKSAFSFGALSNAGWVMLAVAFMPVAFALTAGLIWLSGATLPPLQLLPVGAIIPALLLFFLGAVGEELGWQGYAYPRLIKRHSALNTALIIGVVWALWHVIPFALMGRSAPWIIWQGLTMVLMRIIVVWLVVNTGGRILIAVLFHMMSNSVWGFFANFTPWYDPLFMCVVLLIAVAAIVWISKDDRRVLDISRSGKQNSV